MKAFCDAFLILPVWLVGYFVLMDESYRVKSRFSGNIDVHQKPCKESVKHSRPGSSAGQSTRFLIWGSEVRTLSGAPVFPAASNLADHLSLHTNMKGGVAEEIEREAESGGWLCAISGAAGSIIIRQGEPLHERIDCSHR